MSFKLRITGRWLGDPTKPKDYYRNHRPTEYRKYIVGDELNINGGIFRVTKVHKTSVIVKAIDGYTKQVTLPTYYEKGK
jgi:hypothetical protein